jgi:hypothetical protein
MADLLPNAAEAVIDPRKLRDYALNLEHDSGRFKAAFFAQMGYDAVQWRLLERDIRAQHLSQVVEQGQPSPYGQKYSITAPLRGLIGEARQVTTVWLFRPGNDYAELVTIEPATRSRK